MKDELVDVGEYVLIEPYDAKYHPKLECLCQIVAHVASVNSEIVLYYLVDIVDKSNPRIFAMNDTYNYENVAIALNQVIRNANNNEVMLYAKR